MSNQVVLDLDPSPGNTRNSEGSFADLPRGHLIFAYSRFADSGRDDGAAVIAAVKSTDGGLTWSEPYVIVPCEARRNVMSVSLLRLSDSRLALLYARKDGWHSCMPVIRFSRDHGETFSRATPVLKVKGYHVVNNDRLVQLASGRLIVPVALHRWRPQQDPDDPRRPVSALAGQALVFFALSDDGGRTWYESRDARYVGRANGDGMQEPGVVELGGRLWAWARPSFNGPDARQWQMFSRDEGLSWTQARRSIFASPRSPMSVKRIPSTGDLLAVWNDHSGRFAVAGDQCSRGRTPLVSAISRDDGASWEGHKVLEDSPVHGYCYTAIHIRQGAVLLAYCAGGQETNGILNRLRIRRLSLYELYAGMGGPADKVVAW